MQRSRLYLARSEQFNFVEHMLEHVGHVLDQARVPNLAWDEAHMYLLNIDIFVQHADFIVPDHLVEKAHNALANGVPAFESVPATGVLWT
ncbi:hypothetical protein BBP40_008400 [Aspergillus hancockii]|nr:hypothetical protein BBP40_008400 [Aspergillus hancockii]